MLKYIFVILILTISNAKADIMLVDLATLIDKEIKCLADNIYFEARNESMKGQVAVALVTMNRVKSSLYPNSICNVVWDYKQFSWTIDGLSDKPKNIEAYERSTKIAEFIINAKITGRYIPDITNGATHYHADYINPYWSNSLYKLAKIDTHIFYKFKK